MNIYQRGPDHITYSILFILDKHFYDYDYDKIIIQIMIQIQIFH